jgi:hypothetical protein
MGVRLTSGGEGQVRLLAPALLAPPGPAPHPTGGADAITAEVTSVIQTMDQLIEKIGDRRVVTETGCWEFRGAHEAKGYPSLYIEPKSKRPRRGHVFKKLHRLSCAVANGLDYDDHSWDTRHLCPSGANKGCWNPEHLRPGTNDDNVRDRGSILIKDHHDTVVRMRRAGATGPQIAAAIGVGSNPRVYHYLRQVGAF